MDSAVSDISAVVLTIGEATTQAAIDSIRAQTLPPRDVIVVENVAPFYRALNSGVAQVRTPFVVQVDADMVLDPHCLAALRSAIVDEAALISGLLRDALLGRVCCVKLFRTECLVRYPMQDVLSHETDFHSRVRAAGWRLMRALWFDHPRRDEWHTFGEHRREYSPHYTFSKFIIEGSKARVRRNAGALRDRLAKLHRRGDTIALIAQIGLAYGIAVEADGDLLKPFTEDAEWQWLDGFLRTSAAPAPALNATQLLGCDRREMFLRSYRLGIDLRQSSDLSRFLAHMHQLGESPSDTAWIAQVGLCQGMLSAAFDTEIFERRYKLLDELLGNRSLPNRVDDASCASPACASAVCAGDARTPREQP